MASGLTHPSWLLPTWTTSVPNSGKPELGGVPRNDGWKDIANYGGGGFAIGLRCASAATVAVPIGPCSS